MTKLNKLRLDLSNTKFGDSENEIIEESLVKLINLKDLYLILRNNNIDGEGGIKFVGSLGNLDYLIINL